MIILKKSWNDSVQERKLFLPCDLTPILPTSDSGLLTKL